MDALDFRKLLRWKLVRENNMTYYVRFVDRGGSAPRADDRMALYGKARKHKCGGALLMAELPAIHGTFGVCERCGAEERRGYSAPKVKEVL